MRRAVSRGLTLIEMMVTLVIVSAVVGLLAQAMSQLRRVESLLSGGQLEAAVQQVHAAWLLEALEGVAAQPLDSLERFKGHAQGLTALTVAVPGFPAPRPGLLKLQIRKSSDAPGSVLEMTQASALTAEGAATPLLSWIGEAGRFRYRDVDGEWHEQWPKSDRPGVFEQLPTAILLEIGLDGARVLIAPVRASNVAPPTRKQVDSR